MLVIHDEQLVRQLQTIAENEHRPVEELLKSLLAQYPTTSPPAQTDIDQGVQQVRQKAYAEARRYWQATDNTERLAMTDAELDEQFWLFDEAGIPRLKSEQEIVGTDIPSGSGVWFAQIAEMLAIETNNPIDPEQADEILNADFADYLLKRMDDGTASNLS